MEAGDFQTIPDLFVHKPLLEVSMTGQWAMTAIMGIMALGALLYSIKMAKSEGSWFPIYVCIGATVASLYEPLGDLLVHVTYHEVNQIGFWASFGNKIPFWVVPCYTAFFGLPILMFIKMINNGVTAKSWMMLFLVSLPGAWVFEVFMLELGYIDYHGDNQPLELMGYPIWMAFSNAATMFLSAALIWHLTQSQLYRESPALVALFTPMVIIAASVGTAFPLAVAINGTDSVAIVNIAAVISIILSTLYVWICGKLLPLKAS